MAEAVVRTLFFSQGGKPSASTELSKSMPVDDVTRCSLMMRGSHMICCSHVVRQQSSAPRGGSINWFPVAVAGRLQRRVRGRLPAVPMAGAARPASAAVARLMFVYCVVRFLKGNALESPGEPRRHYRSHRHPCRPRRNRRRPPFGTRCPGNCPSNVTSQA